MTRFVTVDPKGSKHRAFLWEERDGRLAVVDRFASLDEVPGHDELEVWTFAVPTTAQAGSPANTGRYPMLDADGSPLWSGARIAFRLPSHYVNTYSGEGTFGEANVYGGHSFSSDEAHPMWDRNGGYREKSTSRYSAGGDYVPSGPLAGYRMLKSGLGDPFEHGRTPTFVRIIDDPRRVCTLTHAPSASPGFR